MYIFTRLQSTKHFKKYIFLKTYEIKHLSKNFLFIVRLSMPLEKLSKTRWNSYSTQKRTFQKVKNNRLQRIVVYDNSSM